MNYELLSSLYYKSKNEYEQEYNNRFNSIASKRLNISIEENQCFYILTEEVVNKLYTEGVKPFRCYTVKSVIIFLFIFIFTFIIQ